MSALQRKSLWAVMIAGLCLTFCPVATADEASPASQPETAPAAAPGVWPGGKWNERLGETYEPWKTAKEALDELAARAGGPEVVYKAEGNPPFVVPLPGRLTLREAFQAAAAVCGLKATWNNGHPTVHQTMELVNWVDLVGGNVVRIDVGRSRGAILVPQRRKGDGPMPWVWYSPNVVNPSHAWLAKRLFDEGIAMVSVSVGETLGNPKGCQDYNAFYEKLVADHGVTRKAVLLPQSRGGLMLLNWAAEHPQSVAAVGGIYVASDLRSYPGLDRAAKAYVMSKEALEADLAKYNPIDRLADLAKGGVEFFLIHGDADRVVPAEANAVELAKRYKALGGKAEVVLVPGKGHEVAAEFFRCQRLADFLVAQAKATVASKPAEAGGNSAASE